MDERKETICSIDKLKIRLEKAKANKFTSGIHLKDIVMTTEVKEYLKKLVANKELVVFAETYYFTDRLPGSKYVRGKS